MEENNAAVVGGEGVNEPAVAAPEAKSAETGAAPPENDRENAGQSRAENAKYAAARRRAEAERDEAIRRSEEERCRQERENEALRGELAEERARTQDERARLVAQEQLREIAELDGAIRSVDDLLSMPEYGAFYALVKKGVSLVEAYKLTHYEALMQRTAAQSARQAMQSVASRGYMTALAGGDGTGEYLSVPAEVAAQYRLSKPGITDAEIRRKYRRYKNYQRQ